MEYQNELKKLYRAVEHFTVAILECDSRETILAEEALYKELFSIIDSREAAKIEEIEKLRDPWMDADIRQIYRDGYNKALLDSLAILKK